jgi:hypothetical protein
MIYEVFIPAGDTSGFDSTYQIEADNWMRAFFTGVQQSQLAVQSLEGCAVELGTDVTRIAHPGLRVTFRVRQLAESERNAKVIRAVSGSVPIAGSKPAQAPGKADATPSDRHRPVGFKDKATGTFRPIGATAGRTGAEQPGRILAEARKPTDNQKVPAAADLVAPAAANDDVQTALEDAFLEMPTITENNYAIEDAIDFVVDLANRLIPAASTTIFFASDGGGTLYCAAARGQNHKALVDVTIPMERGVAAHALQSGRVISIIDPTKDPRYTEPLQKKLGYPEENILVAPIQSGERAFGVLMLFNRARRKGGFTPYDGNVAGYIGAELGKFIEARLDAGPLD